MGSLVARVDAVPVSHSLHVSIWCTTWEELKTLTIIVSELVVISIVPLDSFEV